MKFIISHDVDHLYPREHFFKDLIIPKLLLRSNLELLSGRITVKEWLLRVKTPFIKKMNYIKELMQFDKENNVRATYFFGMDKCLGMSYDSKFAVPYIKMLERNGFETGVHGCDFKSLDNMKNEYKKFKDITKQDNFGVRMHYVRFDKYTFTKLSKVGYLFDTSEFDKKKGYLIKNLYKIENMWEFPLCIMDTYLPYNLSKAKEETIEIISKAEKESLNFLVVLFHDAHYCNAYKVYKDWYEWLIKEVINPKYEIISYKNAINLLDKVEDSAK